LKAFVIRGYSGNVLEKNVVYKRAYKVNGIHFICYESHDGVIKSVDAGRVEPAEESACVQFSEKLTEAMTILAEIQGNYCGDLTEKQAIKFHKAVAKLAAIEREVQS
jgi:hypothetical protein